MKKNFVAGFTLAGVVLITGCADTDQVTIDVTEPVMEKMEQKMDEVMEKDTVMEKKEAMTKQEVEKKMDSITFADLQKGAKVLLTDDVSGVGGSGTAWTTLKDGMTFHRVVAKDIPALEDDYFYEGWLVKNPALGQFFSTGEMTQDPTTKEWVLDYVHDGDVTDHKKVVITLEPNDGDPAPAAHIIEN